MLFCGALLIVGRNTASLTRAIQIPPVITGSDRGEKEIKVCVRWMQMAVCRRAGEGECEGKMDGHNNKLYSRVARKGLASRPDQNLPNPIVSSSSKNVANKILCRRQKNP